MVSVSVFFVGCACVVAAVVGSWFVSCVFLWSKYWVVGVGLGVR